MESKNDNKRITTLIFDVDDTLYDRGTGFTSYRNGPSVQQFMVEHLNFPTAEAALALRDEYFKRTHATVKGLILAEKEGRFPPPDPSKPVKSPRFDPQDLSEYWANNLKFDLLSKNDELLKDLQECPLKLVAFSNGPRKYVKRVLETLGLWELFGENRTFAVDDVLPFAKPQKEAFDVILNRVGGGSISYEECVLVEDSMKNIRQAKALGMKTVLITGNGNVPGTTSAENAGEVAVHNDPAVDLAIENPNQLRSKASGLWKTPASFQ